MKDCKIGLNFGLHVGTMVYAEPVAALMDASVAEFSLDFASSAMLDAPSGYPAVSRATSKLDSCHFIVPMGSAAHPDRADAARRHDYPISRPLERPAADLMPPEPGH